MLDKLQTKVYNKRKTKGKEKMKNYSIDILFKGFETHTFFSQVKEYYFTNEDFVLWLYDNENNVIFRNLPLKSIIEIQDRTNNKFKLLYINYK